MNALATIKAMDALATYESIWDGYFSSRWCVMEVCMIDNVML